MTRAQATWIQMLDALEAGDLAAAAEHAIVLEQWMNRGGFPALICGRDWPGSWPDLDREITKATCRYVRQQADRVTPTEEDA